MYSVVKKFIDRLDSGDTEKISYSVENTKLAVAVLCYRVIKVDGQIRPEEIASYRKILSTTLDICEDELIKFEEEVVKNVHEESSLFPFTTILRKLPLGKRKEILMHMQEISVSDRELHEFELNLVERAAELLGLEGQWIEGEASSNLKSGVLNEN